MRYVIILSDATRNVASSESRSFEAAIARLIKELPISLIPIKDKLISETRKLERERKIMQIECCQATVSGVNIAVNYLH